MVVADRVVEGHIEVSATQVVFTVPAAQMDTLGSAGIVFRVVTGEVTWKKAKDSVVLDTARLLADQPDLLKTYGMQRQGSRQNQAWCRQRAEHRGSSESCLR